MGGTIDIGRRIELVPMDPHFHNITIGLYRQEESGGTTFQVHTYSGVEGAQQRVDFVTNAMSVLGGMQPAAADIRILRFPCGCCARAGSKEGVSGSLQDSSSDRSGPSEAFDIRQKSAQNIVAGPWDRAL